MNAHEPSLPVWVVEKLARLAELEGDFQAALERAKLESLRQFAYGAGHEINNPLANISARAQTLLVDERDPERRRKLAAINAQAFRAHEMIADLMLFARPPQLQPRRIDLAELVDRVAADLLPEAQLQRISIQRQGVSPCEAWADETHLAAALRALCVNALEAIGETGKIEIELRRPGDGATDEVEIVVRDDGPGISPEQRTHLFDPFYSGREAGRGLGFGLCKCWRIAAEHGGSIRWVNDGTRGACFILSLPPAPPPGS